MKTGITILSSLKKRYVVMRIIESTLFSFSAAFLIFSFTRILNLSITLQLASSLIAAIVLFAIRFVQLGLNTITKNSVAGFLNTQYTELNSSVDLILADQATLTSLQTLQRVKSEQQLQQLEPSVKLPTNLINSVVAFVLSGAAMILLVAHGFMITGGDYLTKERYSDTQSRIIKNAPAEISRATIRISAPAYTKLALQTSQDMNLRVPEGSNATWSLTFTQPVSRVSLVGSLQDTLKFSLKNNTWLATRILVKNDFYQLIWSDSIVHTSDYYKIEVTPDQSPAIKLAGLPQFSSIDLNAKSKTEVTSSLQDDYGLSAAYIIATVSKGSGESVKFREEKLSFSEPDQINGKHILAKRLLDLKKLGLEPGDELYFYVEALDNKTPVPNRSRSETFFISVPDTAQEVLTADGGLGVDLMPEYFRSQRQIIIDTEKLIRDKKRLLKKDFNFASNELGYDQKVLRLRYGQFMGEEFETEIGSGDAHAEEDHAENEKPEDIIKEFGHQHDTENEHNLVDDKNSVKKEIEAEKKNLMGDYLHEHDTEESATFFYQSLKVKLKAALTQMWDAELYLRLYEPEKSLPHQYTALKLLKEISNDSRIYVHRMGFDPPPIKEDKRLTADLNDISNSSRSYEAAQKNISTLTAALALTEKLILKKDHTINQAELVILSQSGAELAAAALENPDLLTGLSALNTILNSNESHLSINKLTILRKAYWRALPKKPVEAGRGRASQHILDETFVQQLTQP